MSETIKIDDYTSLIIAEGEGKYKGTYSIMEGWINRDGEFKPSMCKREFGKKGEKVEKTVPVTVKCGNVEGLLSLANYIHGMYGDGAEQQKQDDDDIPF
jgi:hypothetical protein